MGLDMVVFFDPAIDFGLGLAGGLEPISEQEMEPFLKATADRGTDNWLALGIIAKRINPEWVERVQAALDTIEVRHSDDLQSAGVQLLSDVHDAVSESSHSRAQKSFILPIKISAMR